MPIFETDEDRTFFLTTFPIHPDFTASNDTVNDTVNADLTEMEKRVLGEIKDDAHVTILKMAENLGVSKITVNRAVKGLKEKI